MRSLKGAGKGKKLKDLPFSSRDIVVGRVFNGIRNSLVMYKIFVYRSVFEMKNGLDGG
jgi:hypothetical protein